MFPLNIDMPIGSHRIIEVYEFYDAPVLFATISDDGAVCLNVLLDDSDDAQAWLCAPMSANRFELVRSGDIDLRSAFSATESGDIFVLAVSRTDAPSVVQRSCVELTDKELPESGERLKVETPTLQGYRVKQNQR